MFYGKNYINGKFKSSRQDFQSINPSDESILGNFPQSSLEEVTEAINSAREAQKTWRNLSRIKRAEYIDKLCDLLKTPHIVDSISTVISLETGKSLNESKAEIIESLHMIQFTFGKGREPYGEMVASEIAERDAYSFKKPKGVIAIIAPWNFPFAIGGFWCAAPALLEGNTVVFKPSEDTPMVGQKIAELYELADFPPGVFNLIHGDGKVGEALVEGDIDHVCFTGSAEVGQLIRIACAKSWHKTCSCELGSKSACMVFPDANMDLAVSAAFNSAFKLSGQRCVSSGRILIHESIFEEFSSKFVQLANEMKVGDPFDPDVPFCGPLINKGQFNRVMAYNDLVRIDSDAKVLLDKGFPLKETGFHLGPFVYSCEWGEKAYLKKEVFGPHVALIPFKNLEDAIRIYNGTDYGLALGVLTNDFKIAREIRNRCDFGLGYWNGGSIAAESHLPFGGVKKSGIGWPSAAGTFDAVTHRVSWSVNHGELTFPQGLK